MKFSSIIFLVFVFCLYASRIESARFRFPRIRYHLNLNHGNEDNRFKIEKHIIDPQLLERMNNAADELKKTMNDFRLIQKTNAFSTNSIYGSSDASDARNVLKAERERERKASKTEREQLRKKSLNSYYNLRFYEGYNEAVRNGNNADFLLNWRQDKKRDQLEQALQREKQEIQGKQ